MPAFSWSLTVEPAPPSSAGVALTPDQLAGASAYRDLALDDEGDLYLDPATGDLAGVAGVEGIASDLRSRLQTFLGEYTWNTAIGLPWLQEILGERPPRSRIEELVRGEARDALAAAQTQLTAANDQLDDMRRGAIPKADVTALENSWKTKLETATTESGAKITKLTGALDKNLRQATATQLASELFVSTSLGLPYILPRLKVVEEGEEFVVKVLDANGQPSASTLEDLKKEMVQNKEFAPILRGTRASGGGANGGNGGGGAPSNDKDFDAVSASPKDLAARITQRKQAEGG